MSNIKVAIATLRSARWRSLLTMLGIIIGVASVVTTVSLGEGVRQQVEGQIRHLGSDLITIVPGKAIDRSSDGGITNINLLATIRGANTLNDQDYKTAKQTNGVKTVVPFSVVSAVPRTDEREFGAGFVIATTEAVPEVLNQKVQFGEFFGAHEMSRNIAVIGRRVAHELFQENVPIGKTIQLRDQKFIVGGVFEQFDTSPLSPNADYNAAIFVPFESGKAVTGQTQIYQMLVKPSNPSMTNAVVENLYRTLAEAHGNQVDFTILKQEENLAVTNKILTLLTGLIAGVAAISLFVGGIGIMNIMLLSVIERTREIGIRKAVGATNRQVLNQFMTEAAVLSFAGGVLGLLVSLLANYLIRIFTDIRPVITVPIMGIALLVALAVGLFFGIAPALKAASRDPIDALRHE